MTEHDSTAAKGGAGRASVPTVIPSMTFTIIKAKIILNGLRFTSVQSFRDFAKIVRRAAKQAGVDFVTEPVEGLRPQIREVLFLDTKDFKLYNNAFILRGRIAYEDGFPAGEPEVVFKFRHPDLDTASQLDVRPGVQGNYRVKFKEEWLPQKDRIGGVRPLFSHNVEFRLHPLNVNNDLTLAAMLVDVFPALRLLLAGTKEHVQFVNRTVVEEVLQQFGALDFGKGFEAESKAMWRCGARPAISANSWVNSRINASSCGANN